MKAILLESSAGKAVVKKYVNAARSSQHALPSNGEGAVKKSNADKITKVFDSQREAIARAIKDSFPPRG